MNKFIDKHYFWDISSDHEHDHTVYAVEYKTDKAGFISFEAREQAENKARRAAYELTGNRKAMRQVNDGFRPYSTTCKVISVKYSTKPLKKWQGKSRKAIAEFEFGDEIEYSDFLESLADKMAGNNFFRIDGRKIDWQNRDGVKYINTSNPGKLLEAFYSEDILRLYNGKRKAHFEINAPTHDTPMGSFYYFTPISERTYNKLTGNA